MSSGITMLTVSTSRLTAHHCRQKYCRRRCDQSQWHLLLVVVPEVLCGFLSEVLVAQLVLAFGQLHGVVGWSDLVFQRQKVQTLLRFLKD